MTHEGADKKPIADTAADWFARRRGARLSASEERAFEQWLAASQEHTLAYAQCELAWELSAAVPEPALSRSLTASASPAKSRYRALSPWRMGGAVAASALLVSALLLSRSPDLSDHYQTEIGEQRVVHLEDGSSVMLNTNSALQVRYSRTERHLQLTRGEAFFTVAKNLDRPFVVEVSGSEVRALGTAFNIEKGVTDIEVAVTRGLVEVAAPARFWQPEISTRLEPGQGVHWRADDQQALKPQAVNLERVTAWQASKLYFEGERLADALAEYNRYTRRQFVLVDDDLADERISGVFNLGDDEALTFALEKSLGARVVATENRVLILADH
ncbi:FecR family protein [Gilvimarinus algae]|uniref:FecR domain-containing protein n=1 Tax=Gilvimarinus algae TaxID=3058037 RepID=A0ABT8TIP4_9GAMM|nr:FecR domain-containing protein [Gilvimarinus sp. SDUM040014]MDO3382197.1 FecR domain-containing protein [Gilvimarinus sp. SDUM040014]